MKDKAWLKEKVQTMIDEEYRCYDPLIQHGKHTCRVIMDLIEQLDEPQKPVVPQFVADWIEKQMKFGYECAFNSMTRLRGNAPEKVKFWFDNNPDTYARAWLDGYKVKKQKKYHIYDKSTKGYLGYNADKTRLSWYTSKFPNDVFTEQEIKAIDERYWAFAQEVTE